MIRNFEIRPSIILSFLAAVSLFFVLSASSVFAEGNKADLTPVEKTEIEKEFGIDDEGNTEGDPYETGIGVHADPATFEKDFGLTLGQKEYTITEIEKVISEIIKPEMSDLEKYYTLAIWVNKHVEYDWRFWYGRYYFEYYSHQWDSYGGMAEDEKSVCAGIAIFYASMCHAADLPCKYVRLDPKYLDHTINYIPDINGNAYYVDVTENVFLMSEHSDCAFTHIDKEFAHITKDADNEAFDYYKFENGPLNSSTIKDYYNVPFADWYEEYANHRNTKKIFNTKYEEKGSGETGTHYAAYRDYESNRTEHPDIWFMDDFYKDAADVSAKILAGQFDEQVTSVVGVRKSYDCETIEDLQSFVDRDIAVRYFPSKEDGKIVAKAAMLEKSVDYKVTLAPDGYDEDTKTAEFIIEGMGAYSGTQTLKVKVNSAVVDKAPVRRNGLVYNESAQELVSAGEASCGEMQYALGNETEPTEEFSTAVPTAINAGKYYVWYKAVGDESHGSTQPERIERAIIIDKVQPAIVLDDVAVKVGQTVKLNPVLDNGMTSGFTYNTLDDNLIKLDESGNVTGINAGEANIIVESDLKIDDPNYDVPDWLFITVNVEAASIDKAKVVLSKTSFTYNGKVQKPYVKTIQGKKLKAGTDYEAKWSNKSSKSAGTYTVTIKGKGNYTGTAKATYKINKAANTLKAVGKTVRVKHSKLEKKTVVVKKAKAMTVSSNKGKVTYQLKSVSKNKFRKYFKVNKKTGNIVISKNLEKGTYKVTVNVKAAGNGNYKQAIRVVTSTIKVQ